ncbi:hypothetical protein [Nonomuraea bangladeshensis]|uniref:hypothetical protein n=1 Tax=Nonomuraea bangladeshensis TaxID=404385 RepID=UPI003C308BA8
MIVNAGLGPAIVTGTRIWLDGQLMGAWTKETSRLVRGEMTPYARASTVVQGTGLPSGYTTFLLSVDSYETSKHKAFRDLVEQRFDLEMRYESLYGGENFVETTRSSIWRSAVSLPFGAAPSQMPKFPEQPISSADPT